MRLVNLAPGIAVNPEKIDFVLVQKCQPRDGTGYLASLIYDRLPVVSLRFDTPAEAEQCVDEWTDKLNEAKLGTRVPTSRDLDEVAGTALAEILNELRETSCAIDGDLDSMRGEIYGQLINRLHTIILKHIGETA